MEPSKPATPANCFTGFGNRRNPSRNNVNQKQVQNIFPRRSEDYTNNHVIHIFGKLDINEDDSVVSKSFGNEIVEDFNMNPNIYANITDKESLQDPNTRQAYINQRFRNGSSISHSSQNIVSKRIDTHYVRCSRKTKNINVLNQDNNKGRDVVQSDNYSESTATQKKYAEKTTYCRPVTHLYNQEFIYKFMQRNARLQRLAKEMIMARQLEKDREAWNNYINDLKNKHRYYSNEPSRITTQYVPGEVYNPEMIDDFYNTRFSRRQSNLCSNLLEDLYDTNNFLSNNCRQYPPGLVTRPTDYTINDSPRRYDNDPYCYPTASQGRLKALNKERENKRKRGRYIYENSWACDCDPLISPVRRDLRYRNIIVVENENKTKTADRRQKIQTTQSSVPWENENISQNADPIEQTIKYEGNQTDETTETQIESNGQENNENGSINTQGTLTEQAQNNDQFTQKTETDPIVEQKLSMQKITEDIKQENIDIKKEKNPSEENQLIQPNEPRLNKNRCQNQCKTRCHCNSTKRSSNQPDLELVLTRNHNPHDNGTEEETLKEKYQKVSENVDRLKKKIQTNQYDKNQSTLATIENKLDTLIESINMFMKEIQTKTANHKSCFCVAPVSCQYSKFDRNILNYTKSDSHGLARRERMVCGDNSSTGSSNISKNRIETEKTRMDKILCEEINKSNKVKRDIDKMLNSNMEKPDAFQIPFDIPTRDRSTKVTDSLSKPKINNEELEEMNSPDSEKDGNMTIAVNTEPLGLLALLRISSQSVKQILSYMPQIDYLSYLSMLQFPQLSTNNATHYVCNICGAAFDRPSQLSDHIQQHNLGNTRDCCVCRHVLDLPQRSGLFSCQYCGQRFTRAYCCELHQQTCAPRVGKRHDVSPSLMLLT